MEEKEGMENHWLWLCSVKKLYRSQIHRLIEHFQTPKGVWEASEQELRDSKCLKEQHLKILLENREHWDIEREKRKMREKGIHFCSVEGEEFPERLKKLVDCPYGIFYKGKLPGEEVPCVGIVGARACTSYGKYMARQIGAALAEAGAAVVSGMALGIDGYAQQEALRQGGISVAVLGNGVDICYPTQNQVLYHDLEERGTLLSEYPPGSAPLAFHFPLRNRLISGLSDTILVVEARQKSGSLITADQALEQGKDVYAVPGRAGDPLSAGCNQLIAQGAGIVLSPEQFLTVLNFSQNSGKKKKKEKNVLETEENLVYSCVDLHPCSLQSLVSQLDLPVREVMAILTSLEMKGYIEEPTKNYYTRTGK
jgi:DNA processing protein